jgi:hypothetical protein
MEPSEPGPATDPAPKAEPTLEDLQREKARLEIRDLKRWWFRPSAISAASTIIIGVLAFVSAVWIGYFDKAKLDYERSRLAAEVEKLKAERGKGESRVTELQTEALRLENNVIGLRAEKAFSESVAERRLVEAEAELRRCVEANQSLKHSTDSFESANHTFVKNTRDWQEQSKKQQEEIASLRKQLESSEKTRESFHRQLAVYSPLVRKGDLGVSSYDAAVMGMLDGANFGSRPGTIEIRVVKLSPDGKSRTVLVAPQEVSGDSIWKRSGARIRYRLPPSVYNRISETLKDKSSGLSGFDWPRFPSVKGIAFEVRASTTDETHTDWFEVTTQYVGDTGPIRAGAYDDEP